MSIFILALFMGVVAGLRSMVAPAMVSWAAYLGWLDLHGSVWVFLGSTAPPYILSALVVAELITDKLPGTPSRKVPVQFGFRIISGAFCGAVIGTAGTAVGGNWIAGLLAGAVGAVVGTLGGSAIRTQLVRTTGGKDLPIALLEDIIAIGGAIWVAAQL